MLDSAAVVNIAIGFWIATLASWDPLSSARPMVSTSRPRGPRRRHWSRLARYCDALDHASGASPSRMAVSSPLAPIGRGQHNALTQTRRASLTRAGPAHFRGGHAAAEG